MKTKGPVIAKSSPLNKNGVFIHERNWIHFVIIIISVFVLYGNTIPNKYSLDDNLVVQDHPMVKKGIYAIPEILTSRYRDADKNTYGYRPVAMITFAIENEFFGQNPQVSHFINILLYALLLLLMYFLLIRLFEDFPKQLLLFVVLLFAAHPLHTEVVASLKNREELLCFLFGLAAILVFINAYHTQKIKHRVWKGLLGFIFLMISIFSKQTGLMFCFLVPVIFLQFYLLEIQCFKNMFSGNLRWRKYLWLLFASAFLLLAGYLAYKLPEAALPSENKPMFGFENPLFDHDSMYNRLCLGFMSLLFYLKLLLIPYPLRFYYGFDAIPLREIYDFRIILSAIFYFAILMYALFNFYRKKIISFAVLFYFSGIIMFANFFLKMPGIIGERLLFIPSLGFCLVLAYLIYYALNRKDILNKKRRVNKFTYVILFIIVMVYSVQTISRNFSWKDHLALYRADIGNLENSAKANCMIADEMMRKIYLRGNNPASDQTSGELVKALEYYKTAIGIYPGYASVYNNIGTIYFNFKQDYQTAIPFLRKAIFYDSTYKQAFSNLALSYKMLNKSDSALFFYALAFRYDSSNISLISDYANLENENGNFEKAVLLNKKIILLDSSSDLPYINLGNYYLEVKDTIEAIANWEIALKKAPQNEPMTYDLFMYYKTKGNILKAEYYKALLN